MAIDITLSLILQEVQKEIKEEFGEDISIQEIADIQESQFHALLLGLNYGIGTRVLYFGSFYPHDVGIKVKRGKELEAKKDSLTKEEYEKALLEIKKKNKKENKVGSQNRRKAIRLEDLLNKRIISPFRNRYEHLINDYKRFLDEEE